MAKQPLVSIVIPVFNGSNYLGEAIDSALSQTYKNIEVIVVNDGSSDEGKTKEVALSYGNAIRYLEKGNGGVASAINYAIKKMNGQFLSWLSHDDKYHPWKIDKQVDYYFSMNQERTVVFSHQDFINKNGVIVRKERAYKFEEERIAFYLFFRYFVGGCSLLIPKIALNEAGEFSERYKYVQDYEMWFRLINCGYKFVYLPIASVMVRIHDRQDTVVYEEKVREEQFKLFTDIPNWLHTKHFVGADNSELFTYLYIAFQYKRNGQRDLYKHFNRLAINKKDSFTLKEKLFVRLFQVCFLFSSKYLDPRAYFRKITGILHNLPALRR